MGTPARVVVLPVDSSILRIESLELPDPGPNQVVVKQFASASAIPSCIKCTASAKLPSFSATNPPAWFLKPAAMSPMWFPGIP